MSACSYSRKAVPVCERGFDVTAADGTYTFYVAGTLNVGGNQLPGVYNGTFQIDVSYN